MGRKRTRVVNLRKSLYDVYCGRGPTGEGMNTVRIGDRGWLGNPFTVEMFGREKAIEFFRDMFLSRVENDEEFRESVLLLRGQRLGCFCKPEACHADVIAEWIDSQHREMEAANDP